jgi:hypothetical protein
MRFLAWLITAAPLGFAMWLLFRKRASKHAAADMAKIADEEE